jgi:predicted dehydrogenase
MSNNRPTKIALVGCGYICHLYLKTLGDYSYLSVAGVHDLEHERAQNFANYRLTRLRYPNLVVHDSIESLLADDEVEVVVNLTNPASHFEVNKAALEAGKHVYSEKPLALNLTDAEMLVALAQDRGLLITCAPCSLLGNTAQTIWKALRENAIGNVRLIYAELDDDAVHKRSFSQWVRPWGPAWPYKDEFEVGCTFEHAGYVLTWLAAFFGPAERVVAYSDVLVPDKGTPARIENMSPDFSVGIIKFRSGPVARITNSILAPRDHSVTFIGEEGVISIKDSWFYDDEVVIQRSLDPVTPLEYLSQPESLPLVQGPQRRSRYFYQGEGHDMDFARGVDELVCALREKRPPRLGGEFALHVLEITQALHEGSPEGLSHKIRTSFDSIEPMPWAL